MIQPRVTATCALDATRLDGQKTLTAKSQNVLLPIDDPKIRRPDITRAQTLLKWEPTVQIEEGLVDTINYFRAKIEKTEAAHERR